MMEDVSKGSGHLILRHDHLGKTTFSKVFFKVIDVEKNGIDTNMQFSNLKS